MSKTKLKDNTIFRWIIIPICMALSLFGHFIPPIGGLTSDAIGVICIFVATLTLWLTIGIDWPSLLCILSLGLLPSLGMKSVIQSCFGDLTFVFLLFTFVCTYAISKTTIIKRIAINFVNSKLAKKSGYGFIFMFLLSVLVIGLFMSPSVLFVVMLPILNEILEVAKIDKTDKIAKVMMIGLGFSVSISSGMTPIAHVFPIIAINAAKLSLSSWAYMAMAIPTGIILFLLMYGLLILGVKPEVNKLKNTDVSEMKTSLPKINKQEILVMIVFSIVILLWIVPSLFKNINPDYDAFIKKYGFENVLPPLIGTLLLCIIRVDKKPIININDALKNGVPWSALIMCLGALALGAALKNDAVGLKPWLEASMSESLKTFPAIALLIIFTLWAAIQTNVSSNMVTATLVATVASSVLAASEVGVNLASLVYVIGMLASFAFATPPSMPHIALITSSESCTTKDVLIYGSIMMVLSVVISLLVSYPIGMLLL